MPTRDAKLDTRRQANLAGQITALVVALAGIAVVVAPVVLSTRSRTALFADPFARGTTTRVVERTEGDGSTSIETTTTDVEQSALDMALAGGGAILLRLGIVAAAAFLAGAAVQRTKLAHFSLELGPIKLPDLPEAVSASTDALLELSARVESNSEQIVTISETSARAIGAASARIRRLSDELDRQQVVLDRLLAEAGGRPASRVQRRQGSSDEET